MKLPAIALFLAAALAFAPAAHAAVSNDEILAKLNKIEEKQDYLIAQLAKVQEELNIVKVRVSLRA